MYSEITKASRYLNEPEIDFDIQICKSRTESSRCAQTRRPRIAHINLLIRSIIRLADELQSCEVEYIKSPFSAIACIVGGVCGHGGRHRRGRRAYNVFRTSHQPPEVCLFINKRERYSTALGAVCITNLKEANLEALLTGMEYKIQ